MKRGAEGGGAEIRNPKLEIRNKFEQMEIWEKENATFHALSDSEAGMELNRRKRRERSFQARRQLTALRFLCFLLFKIFRAVSVHIREGAWPSSFQNSICSNLFRISDFGFRISDLQAVERSTQICYCRPAYPECLPCFSAAPACCRSRLFAGSRTSSAYTSIQCAFSSTPRSRASCSDPLSSRAL